MINNKFFNNIVTCVLNAASRIRNMDGRSSRSEFRYVYGVYVVQFSLLYIMIMFYAYHGIDFTSVTAVTAANEVMSILSIIVQIISLLCYVVVFPLMVRRFQDTDRSATMCKVVFAYNIVSAVINTTSLYSVTTIHQYWLMIHSISTINFIILCANLYVYAILIFAKGSEGRNEYGMPSCALVKHTIAG